MTTIATFDAKGTDVIDIPVCFLFSFLNNGFLANSRPKNYISEAHLFTTTEYVCFMLYNRVYKAKFDGGLQIAKMIGTQTLAIGSSCLGGRLSRASGRDLRSQMPLDDKGQTRAVGI